MMADLDFDQHWMLECCRILTSRRDATSSE
jgi:hypothetical protein